MEGLTNGNLKNSMINVQNQSGPRQGKLNKVKVEEDFNVLQSKQSDEKKSAGSIESNDSIKKMNNVVKDIQERIRNRIKQSLKENDYFVTSEFRKMREHLESLLEKTGVQSNKFFNLGMNMQWEIEAQTGEQDFRFFVDVSYKVFSQNSRELNESFLNGAESVIQHQNRDEFQNYLQVNYQTLSMEYSEESLIQFNQEIAQNPELISENIDDVKEVFLDVTGLNLKDFIDL